MRSLVGLPLSRSTCDSGFVRPSMMGKLFVSILIIAVFEGALRKWISPILTFPLIFIRDCMAIYGIYWAVKRGKMNASQTGAQILWVWLIIVLLWGLLQLMVNQSSLIIFFVGIRYWLLYLCFAYAAAVSISAIDFRYISKIILHLLLVMAPLAIVQFFLPASAFLNKELVGDDEGVFLVTADIVRTTGTFSFALGYSIFLAVASPFVLSLLTPGNRLRGGKWKSIAIVLVLAFATIVSGSRSALVMFGLLFLAYIFISIRYSKVSHKGSTVFLLAGVLLLLSVVPYIFSEAMDALLERFETAAEIEDFSQRMVTILFGEQDVYERFKLIGHGIGAGNNFANSTASNGVVFLLEETESARTVLEGGLVGIVFIGIKLLVIIIGLRQSRRIAKSSSNTLPLLLWFSLAIGLLTWPIIGQLTANVLGYLLLGLGIASLRLSDNRI